MEAINNYYIENSIIKEVKNMEEKSAIGKVIYEVLRVIDGKPLFLEKHLLRMKSSFDIVNLKYEFDDNKIKLDIEKLVDLNEKTNGNIKITYDISEKNLKIFFIKHAYPSKEMYEKGIKTILYFGERENPNAKIVDSNFREKVTKKINENEAYEAILIDRNEYITEGSKSNIFMVKDNVLLTSPVESVLPGVTRGQIIELAIKNKIKVQEIKFKYLDIDKLDGMFISGTSPKILPVNKVDNINLRSNSNKIINNLIKYYNNNIINYIKTN